MKCKKRGYMNATKNLSKYVKERAINLSAMSFACLGLANQILEDFQALAERAIKNPVQYQEAVQSFLAGAAPALYRIEGVLHQGRSFSRDKHHAESLLPDLQPNLNSVDIEYVSLEEEQEETYK